MAMIPYDPIIPVTLRQGAGARMRQDAQQGGHRPPVEPTDACGQVGQPENPRGSGTEILYAFIYLYIYIYMCGFYSI